MTNETTTWNINLLRRPIKFGRRCLIQNRPDGISAKRLFIEVYMTELYPKNKWKEVGTHKSIHKPPALAGVYIIFIYDKI